MDIQNEFFAEYKDVVTVYEVMKMLGLGRTAVYQIMQKGKIRTIKVGRKYVIPKQSVINFLTTGESIFRKD